MQTILLTFLVVVFKNLGLRLRAPFLHEAANRFHMCFCGSTMWILFGYVKRSVNDDEDPTQSLRKEINLVNGCIHPWHRFFSFSSLRCLVLSLSAPSRRTIGSAGTPLPRKPYHFSPQINNTIISKCSKIFCSVPQFLGSIWF